MRITPLSFPALWSFRAFFSCHSIHHSLVIPGLTGNLVGVDARSGPGMTEKQTGDDREVSWAKEGNEEPRRVTGVMAGLLFKMFPKNTPIVILRASLGRDNACKAYLSIVVYIFRKVRWTVSCSEAELLMCLYLYCMLRLDMV